MAIHSYTPYHGRKSDTMKHAGGRGEEVLVFTVHGNINTLLSFKVSINNGQIVN